LKSERAAIRTQIGVLQARRDAILGAASAEGEDALREFEFDAAEAVRSWVEDGCEGPQPVANAEKHAELRAAVEAAAHAEKLRGPGLEVIASQIAAQVDLLKQSRIAIEQAACAEMVAQFEAQADRSRKLRAELSDIVTECYAGWVYFKDEADKVYAQTRRRNRGFDNVVAAARNCLPGNPAALDNSYGAADGGAIRTVAGRFAGLCDG
jgi:hypothetical protein